MAEIGLIASIIGVAGAGAKVSLTLFKIASQLGAAADEVRLVAGDASALSLVLTLLSNTLKARRANADDGEQIAGALVSLCRSVTQNSEELVRDLEPLIKRDGSTVAQSMLRVRWIFGKPKFATHRQALESLKSTLNLLVSTMCFSSATAGAQINGTRYCNPELKLTRISDTSK